MTTNANKPNDLHLARMICAIADQGGTIQADRLIRIMPDPRNHRAMSIREAWAILIPHRDPDDIAELLWG